jgi:glycosyltransferase involved in cell wall biosynthesis
MEMLGVSIYRFALRSGGNLVDDLDRAEEKQTRFILNAAISEQIRCSIIALLTQPLVVFSIIRQAVQMGWSSDRGILRHLAYVVEAAVLAKWCRSAHIQHVHAHFGTNSAAIALFTSRLTKIPYSFTAHGPEEFEKGVFLSLEMKLQHAAFAVCVSSYGRSQLMRLSNPDLWNKIALVHCGLDNMLLAAAPREVLSVPRFVCVARLSEAKAHLILISAARILRENGVHCEIVLVGDGPMRESIARAILEAGLQDQIIITGWVSAERIKDEIEKARALVLASFSENMPVAIMEAMALSRPVISTYVAGIPELVTPGKTGWLVPPGDEVALADAMREALMLPVTRLAAMGAAARSHVSDQHDALKEAKKLKNLIEQFAISPLS